MILVFILLISSFFFSLFGHPLLTQVSLALNCFVLALILLRRRDGAVHRQKYIFTPKALECSFTSELIKAGMLKGDYIVSSEYIALVLSNIQKNIQKQQSMKVLENVNLLSGTGRLEKSKTGFSNMELFKYAYENGCTIVMCGENISANISKVFSVDTVDIARISVKDAQRASSLLKVYADSWDGSSLKGYVVSDEQVVVTDGNENDRGRIIEMEVERDMSIKNRKVYYGRKK